MLRCSFAARSSQPDVRPSSGAHVPTLRSQLHAFLKHVHPDRFHAFPLVQRVNHESLTRLNGFLDALSYYAETRDGREAVSRQVELSFYVRREGTLEPEEAQAVHRGGAGDTAFRLLKSRIVLPEAAFTSPRRLLELAARQLDNLIRLSGRQEARGTHPDTEGVLAPKRPEPPASNHDDDGAWEPFQQVRALLEKYMAAISFCVFSTREVTRAG